MTENPVRSLVVLARGCSHFFILLCCATLILEGCSARRRPDIPWATAIMVRPAAQARITEGNGASDDPLPELRFELPPVSSRLIGLRPVPLRPRNSVSSNAAAGNDSEKSDAPTIAPQLTPQESAVAQQQTNESLNIAERNLGAARGKTLTAAQTDLVSKIRGFINDARAAAQITDWSRARSLAKKAQVLSEELASSL